MSQIVKEHIYGNFKVPKVRSSIHRSFVKKFPCSIVHNGKRCNQKPVDPHHLMKMGGHGMALTECDMWIVPLCREHHSELTDYPDEEIFWNRYNYGYSEPIAMAADFSRRSPCKKIRQKVKDWEAGNATS